MPGHFSTPAFEPCRVHRLWQCQACHKLDWAGSYLVRMNERFDRLFGIDPTQVCEESPTTLRIIKRILND
jgi:uncharacterized protein with PIN domain